MDDSCSTPSAARSTRRASHRSTASAISSSAPAVRVRFPIKNGIPVLVADEAEPAGRLRVADRLPAVRSVARSDATRLVAPVPLLLSAASRSPCDGGRRYSLERSRRMPGRLLVSLVAAGRPRRPPGDRRVAGPGPADLPRYDLALTLDTAGAHARASAQTVTWTNRHSRPTDRPRLQLLPALPHPATATTCCSPRRSNCSGCNPSLGIDRDGRHGVVDRGHARRTAAEPLAYHYQRRQPDRDRASHCPQPVGAGRVGHGRTRLRRSTCRTSRAGGASGRASRTSTNSLPVLAFYDDAGWQPMPFVPWHQPFFNEAGVYTRHDHAAGGPEARLLRPRSKSEADLGDGWKTVDDRAVRRPRLRGARAAPRYREFTARRPSCPTAATVAAAGAWRSREHEFYADEMLKIVGEAIPVYSQWFGPFPYAAVHHRRVVLRVERQRVRRPGHDRRARLRHAAPRPRVRRVPRLARDLPPVVVQPRRHQRLRRDVHGRGGGDVLHPPAARPASTARTTRCWTGRRASSGCRTSTARTTATAACTARSAAARCRRRPQELPEFGHLVSLFTGAYDRGSKVVGMIEDRLGEAAFLDFIRGLVREVLVPRAAGRRLQPELEAYTGQRAGTSSSTAGSTARG